MCTMKAVGAASLLALVAAYGPPRASAAENAVPVVVASVTAVVGKPLDAESVLEFLRRYESTLASGRVERIVGLYADFDPTRRRDLERYFRDVVSGLVVRLDDVRIAVDGDRAEVDFDRTDAFTDRETGRPVEKAVSLTRHLERDGRTWRLVLSRP